MLKITTEACADGQRLLRLEGRLAGPWIAELERLALAESGIGAEGLRLDLSGVGFVDAGGAALLCALVQGSVVLEGCSPLIVEQLRAGLSSP